VKKHFLYILLSFLMLSSLLIVSCGDKETENIVTNYADPAVPKYGGIHYRIRTTSWNAWDYAARTDMFNISMMGEELLGGDWTRGPAGANENDWTSGFGGFTDTLVGRLAESWEMPDNETIVYHIRPDVHWWDKEPANGREVTAEDIAWNIERQFSSPMSFNYRYYTITGKAPLSATALDNHTVEVKVIPEWQGMMAAVIGDHMWLICPDAVEANGGETLTEWQQFIGTGPFMIDNYVIDSYIEYVRNPNYWQMDPLHPENRLPYADGMKELIFNAPTKVAQYIQALFINGKIDTISTASMVISGWEDVDYLKKKLPEVEVKSFANSITSMIWPRLDNRALPFSDIRIRYAMNLVVNQRELVDDYYGGHAELLAWPYMNLPVFDRIYTPLEEQSQVVQDLFGYDVERARELMAEAGYTDGFNFRLDCAAEHIDFLAIIKEYLKAINIDLELARVEFTAWMGGTYEQAFYGSDYLLRPQEMMSMIGGSPYNYSRVSDQRIQEAYSEIARYIGRDNARVAQILKEIGPYELELAVPIYLPSPHSFVVWWPWLQNFYGAIGGGGNDNIDEYLMYFWIDTDMKTAMGY